MKFKRNFAAAALLLLLAAGLFGPLQSRPVYGAESGFACYTLDPLGERTNALYDEEPGVYYLSLPNRQAVSEYVLYVEGVSLRSASKGETDRESGTVSGAFAGSRDQVVLTDTRGQVYNITALQSDLPSVSVTLKDAAITDLHVKEKDRRFAGTRVLITDAGGQCDVFTETAELKGRGNTSWDMPDKKGYQIKFDKRSRVLGMEKAKKWVLLANAFDDSLVRNRTAFYFAEQLGMAWVPEYQPVDLWLNGEYRGTYLLGEKVEVDERRLALNDPLGVLMEHDNAFFAESDIWFEDQILNRCFALKEAVSEDDPALTAEAVESFHEKLDTFLQFLTDHEGEDLSLEELARYIDVESFAQWILVNEYLLNVESYTTSFFWYTDGREDVLHLGPVWDFDSSMGNKYDFNEYTDIFGSRQQLFGLLLHIPAFQALMDELFAANEEVIVSLPDHALQEGESLSASAYMNYTRWRCLGEENIKTGLAPYAATYREACGNLAAWLNNRYDFYCTVENRWLVQ